MTHSRHSPARQLVAEAAPWVAGQNPPTLTPVQSPSLTSLVVLVPEGRHSFREGDHVISRAWATTSEQGFWSQFTWASILVLLLPG